MGNKKSNLDEHQELTLLKIESRGFWLAFWSLIVAMATQTLLFDNFNAVISEWIVFMGLALYMGFSCFRVGIWSRYLDMSNKTCLLVSVISGLSVAVFLFAFSFIHYRKPIVVSLCAGGFIGTIIFIVCFVLLVLLARATKKRQDRLNAEPDNNLNE